MKIGIVNYPSFQAGERREGIYPKELDHVWCKSWYFWGAPWSIWASFVGGHGTIWL